jgi:ribokinase
VTAYDAIVSTGGIGTGMFFALEGNHTLGREESRAAQLLDQRDFCKLHIVCHYLRRLLGDTFVIVPIGKVGTDEAGRAILAELRVTGLDTTHVTTSPRPTLSSVCFLYPDGDGGNISTSRSASADVQPADVQAAGDVFVTHAARGMALALPEVPLRARVELLELATEHGFLRVAALVSGEVQEALAIGLLDRTDLLAVNIDEAAALVGEELAETPVGDVVRDVAAEVSRRYPHLSLVVTAGARGSWSWDKVRLVHTAALDVPLVSSAGAGDAHLAGLVVGLVAGLDLAAANEFATVVSGLKVGSRHTINPELDSASVLASAEQAGRVLPDELRSVLADAGASTVVR